MTATLPLHLDFRFNPPGLQGERRLKVAFEPQSTGQLAVTSAYTSYADSNLRTVLLPHSGSRRIINAADLPEQTAAAADALAGMLELHQERLHQGPSFDPNTKEWMTPGPRHTVINNGYVLQSGSSWFLGGFDGERPKFISKSIPEADAVAEAARQLVYAMERDGLGYYQ